MRFFFLSLLSRVLGLIARDFLSVFLSSLLIWLWILFAKSQLSDFCKLHGRTETVRVCVCVCVYFCHSVASYISETSEAIAITFDSVTVSVRGIHLVSFFLDLELNNSALCKTMPIAHSYEWASRSEQSVQYPQSHVALFNYKLRKGGMWRNGYCIHLSRKRPGFKTQRCCYTIIENVQPNFWKRFFFFSN